MVVKSVLAIDIGGTKIASALGDIEGHLVAVNSIPTPSFGDAEDVFSAIANTVSTSLENAGDSYEIVACGIGCGGPMDFKRGLVSPLNIKSMVDFPIVERVASYLGVKTFMDNDAKALALGEGWIGAAKNSSNFIALVISTGVGGGIVLDGKLLNGRLGNAGHIGHVNVEPQGRECVCGSFGCLEAEASGTAIEKFTGLKAQFATEEVKERTGVLVGRAVSSVCNLLDLDLAVIAGSVAVGFGEKFFKNANSELMRLSRLPYSRSSVIVPSSLNGLGPLTGALKVGWNGVAS